MFGGRRLARQNLDMATPRSGDEMSACDFCGNDIFDHTPVFVEEFSNGEREPAGAFCNYACLTAYIDAEELEVGACCHL